METKYITVTRTFTYDVEKIKKEWVENHGTEATDDDIMEQIQGWVDEDMRSPLSRHDLVWLDDEGNDIW